MNIKVVLESHNPEWDQVLIKEIEIIQNIFGSNLAAVHHIGSTAIPGIVAKPIIDLLPVVKSINEVDQLKNQFENLGYKYRGEFGIKGRRYIVGLKPDGLNHRCHFHIFEEEHEEILRHLAFRDYLRKNVAVAKAYESLKIELMTKFENDRKMYQSGKSEFCEKILKEIM
jgi:GrpB-like predicted nucleotidyltransferase (UPF0157 family)